MSKFKYEAGSISLERTSKGYRVNAGEIGYFSTIYESVESVLRLPDGSVLSGAGGVYVVRGESLIAQVNDSTLGSSETTFTDGLVLTSASAIASVLPLVVRHIPEAAE